MWLFGDLHQSFLLKACSEVFTGKCANAAEHIKVFESLGWGWDGVCKVMKERDKFDIL